MNSDGKEATLVWDTDSKQIATDSSPTNTAHLVLLHEDCSDLCRNHRHDGADVIFKAVRKAAPSRDAVFIEMRHVQSHAFHLCN